MFTDGTTSRQVEMHNLIIGVPEDNGKGSSQSFCYDIFLKKDETSESQCQSVVEKFRKGRDLINIWGEIIERNYPGREDLLDLIPNANYLII